MAGMKTCQLCPGGDRCRGSAMAKLIVRLCREMDAGGSLNEALRRIGKADLKLFGDMTAASRTTCWGNAYADAAGLMLGEAASAAWKAEGSLDGLDALAAALKARQRVSALYSALPGGKTIDVAAGDKAMARKALATALGGIVPRDADSRAIAPIARAVVGFIGQLPGSGGLRGDRDLSVEIHNALCAAGCRLPVVKEAAHAVEVILANA